MKAYEIKILADYRMKDLIESLEGDIKYYKSKVRLENFENFSKEEYETLIKITYKVIESITYNKDLPWNNVEFIKDLDCPF